MSFEQSLNPFAARGSDRPRLSRSMAAKEVLGGAGQRAMKQILRRSAVRSPAQTSGEWSMSAEDRAEEGRLARLPKGFYLEIDPTQKNVPDWRVLSEPVHGYRIHDLFSTDYPGKLLSDFKLTHASLDAAGVEADLQERILTSLDRARVKEATQVVANVLKVEDLFSQTQREAMGNPDSFSTADILRAIDEAGYRPATLAEFLAFVKQRWQPDLEGVEENGDGVACREFVTFGSVFSQTHSPGKPVCTHVFFQKSNKDRFIHHKPFARDRYRGWNEDQCLLVVRKE